MIVFGGVVATNINASVVNGTAQANFLTALSIGFTNHIDFGIILPPAAGDIITIHQSTGTPTISTSSGNSVLTGSFAQGEFDVTGTANSTATIQVSTSTTITGPGDPMTVDNFAVNRSAPFLGPTGTTPITIGARLNINENQTPGNYTGSYSVTVAYQ